MKTTTKILLIFACINIVCNAATDPCLDACAVKQKACASDKTWYYILLSQ